MKIKNTWLIILGLVQLGCYPSCSKEKEAQRPAPEFKSSIPANNATNVNVSTTIEVVFDEVISLAANHGITLNSLPAEVTASFTKLIFTTELSHDTNYKLIIPSGAVTNTFNVPLSYEIALSFTTEEKIDENSAAMEFVANMGVGWNLGNTLDTKSADETAWGNPKATKALIDAVRAKGFKTLRVPVTWQYHMGSGPDYTIEEAWLDRVEEVVNYGLDNEMLVIVNIHHDEEWLKPTYADVEVAKKQLEKVWTQIATRFKDYDNTLIFETLNEPRLKGSAREWRGGTPEGRDCINQYHEVAVQAIRATGSHNANRYIMVCPYAASASQEAIDDLVLPSSSNLIVSTHNYFPYGFSQSHQTTNWGSQTEKQALDAELDRVYEKFIAKGIPLIMGEWGNMNNNNTEARIRHAEYYAKGCIQRGICPIWWDNGNSDDFALIDRNSYQWIFPGIADVVVQANKK